jgi:ribosomal protein S18 acetylase RimI-like enzyme
MSSERSGDQPGYVVRPATEADLDAIVGFEIQIARISFADEAMTDPAFHRKRVLSAIGRPGEFTLVAAPAAVPAPAPTVAPQQVAGWAWMSVRTNSVSGARYGNFRSLAVLDGATEAGELLLTEVIDQAETAGLDELVGKVHARNLNMRTLYRKFGFDVVHLSMHRRRAGNGS